MNRFFLTFVAVSSIITSAVAEKEEGVYSLKVVFQKVGEESSWPVEFPSLDLEHFSSRVIGPHPGPGNENLVVECRVILHDTPEFSIEVYDPADSFISDEGKLITSTRIEASCPIVYGKETVIMRNKVGILSFVVEAPASHQNHTSEANPDQSKQEPSEAIAALVVDSVVCNYDSVSLDLYNSGDRSVEVTEIKLAGEKQNFERRLAIGRTESGRINGLDTGSVHRKIKLPAGIESEDLRVEIVSARYVD